MLILALAQAQGICTPKEITVSEVRGRVYFKYEGKRRILDDSVVQVVSQRDNRVLGEMTADSEGRYSIKGIKPGRYWLRAKHPQVIG
jgi:protocatechuate 3,4-dioxygenase beta subunit